jgi:hypothetical protein
MPLPRVAGVPDREMRRAADVASSFFYSSPNVPQSSITATNAAAAAGAGAEAGAEQVAKAPPTATDTGAHSTSGHPSVAGQFRSATEQIAAERAAAERATAERAAVERAAGERVAAWRAESTAAAGAAPTEVAAAPITCNDEVMPLIRASKTEAAAKIRALVPGSLFKFVPGAMCLVASDELSAAASIFFFCLLFVSTPQPPKLTLPNINI